MLEDVREKGQSDGIKYVGVAPKDP
jgi:hypothetical protein